MRDQRINNLIKLAEIGRPMAGLCQLAPAEGSLAALANLLASLVKNIPCRSPPSGTISLVLGINPLQRISRHRHTELLLAHHLLTKMSNRSHPQGYT